MINLSRDEAISVLTQQAQTIKALEMSIAGFLDRERKFRATLKVYESRVVAFADAWDAWVKTPEGMVSLAVVNAAGALDELAKLIKAGQRS